jgi:tetratricopeptide (TPR) repeat protein
LWTILLLASGLAVYSNSFTAPFVFDDQGSIVDNSHIRHLWPLRDVLLGPTQSAIAGRPVVGLSLALNYAWGGLTPWPYRAGNLSIHLLAGLLLFGIVRRGLTSEQVSPPFRASADRLAFACALIWLIHPLQTEVIDYVTQRTESMMGLCYLLTFYASMRAMSDTGAVTNLRLKPPSDDPSASESSLLRWPALAVTSCALGMASKESMVTAPVMVLLYDAVFCAGSVRGALRARRGLYTGLAVTWIVLIALVVPGPRSHSAGLSSGVTSWTYLLNQPRMVITYLTRAVWPTSLVLDYGPTVPVSPAAALPYGIGVLVIMLGSMLLWRRRPALGLMAAWVFVTLGPSSSIVPIATEVGAERRMYLPLAALVTLAVLGAHVSMSAWLGSRGRWQRAASTALLVGVACTLGWLTLQRNREYQSATGIWRTVLARHPHGRAHYQLGVILREEGQRDEALAHYRAALIDCPDAHYALGFELDADGKHDEAIAHYREYIRLRPDDLQVVAAHNLLGHALLVRGRLEEAKEALGRSLVMRPNDPDAHGFMADVLLRQTRYEDAAREYRARLRLVPNDPVAHQSLGVALIGQDLAAEAVKEFARAAELAPNDPLNRLDLGNALADAGRLGDAVRAYHDGLVLAPASVPIRNALAAVLAAQGDTEAAVDQFRRSLELDPRNQDTRRDYAALLYRLGRVNEASRLVTDRRE